MISKKEQLQVVIDEVYNCTNCPLYKNRMNYAFHRGNEDAKIVLVGEALGEEESLQGKPFVGKAGKMLDSVLTQVKLDPENDVYICNILKDRPPNNRKPHLFEVEACMPFLERQLDIVSPKIIMTLGATAMSALLGWMSISKNRGKWGEFKNIPTIGTFHPSYLLRKPHSKEFVLKDLEKVKERLKNDI